MQNMYSIFLYHSSETDIFIKMLLFCSTSWKIVPWLGISKSYSPAFGGRLWNFGAPCDLVMEFIFSANKNEDQSSISQNDEEFTCISLL